MPDRITPPAVPNTTIDTGVPGRRVEIAGSVLGPSLRVTNTDTGRSITANLTGDEPHRIAQALAPELSRHPIVDGRVEPGLVATGYITVAPIDPTDCDRTTVYAGECRNFAGTEWIPFEAGRRRSPDARDGNTWLVDCANGSFWTPDRHIRNLVRLVPARPDVDVDRWRRARDIAVAERDAAREELDAERAKCEQLRDLILGQRENVGKAIDAQRAAVARAERAERERDGWKARAEQAEARTAPAVTREDTAGVIDHWIKQGGNHEALLDDLWSLLSVPAPAVTREDVEKAIHGVYAAHGDWAVTDEMADAIMALLSGDDPAVYVLRESDLPQMEDDYIRNFYLGDGRNRYRNATDEEILEAREMAKSDLRWLIAVERRIEAEAAQPDPVEAKAEALARELWKVLEPDDGPWIGYDDAHGEGGHPSVFMVDRIARHLVSEGGDE